MDFGSSSVPGPRPYNEDDCLLIDMTRYQKRFGGLKAFIMVSDGMGGHASGDVASRIAVETAESYIGDLLRMAERSDVDVDGALALREISEEAHEAVVAAAAERGAESMGATYVAALVSADRAWIGHIGDSRAYLLTRSGARQLTTDHSQIGRMIAEGILTEEQAQHHPQRNVIDRALGFGEASADTLDVDLRRGDAILLCSDGVSTALTGDQMMEIATTSPDAKTAAQRLTAGAIEAGGDDNATAVIWSDDWRAFRGGAAERSRGRRGAPTKQRLARHDRAQRASFVAVGLVLLVAVSIAGVALSGSGGAVSSISGTTGSTATPTTSLVSTATPPQMIELRVTPPSPHEHVYLRSEKTNSKAGRVSEVTSGTVLNAQMRDGNYYRIPSTSVFPEDAVAPVAGVKVLKGREFWPDWIWIHAESVTVIAPPK